MEYKISTKYDQFYGDPKPKKDTSYYWKDPSIKPWHEFEPFDPFKPFEPFEPFESNDIITKLKEWKQLQETLAKKKAAEEAEAKKKAAEVKKKKKKTKKKPRKKKEVAPVTHNDDIYEREV